MQMLLFPNFLKADIFKCTSDNGKIVYQDTPCAGQKGIVVDNSQSRKIHQLEEENKKIAEKSSKELDRTLKKGLTIGMTKNEVITSPIWGYPYKGNRTTTGYGTREQWIYKTVIENDYIYLYFENDLLTSIQD